jgi:hypothetical protein
VLTGSIPAPLSSGAPPLPPLAGAWNNKTGAREGLWLATIGDWYVEVRATYPPEESDEIGAAVGDLIKSAYSEIPDR